MKQVIRRESAESSGDLVLDRADVLGIPVEVLDRVIGSKREAFCDSNGAIALGAKPRHY
jgi:hypothetical protein